MSTSVPSPRYRGRLAPSPTGLLHLGHVRTFWTAAERARARGGTLILRNEDLDQERSRAEFAAAMVEDLRWLGIAWSEGPDVGGPHGPYDQSARGGLHAEAFERLRAAGRVYPCACSRRDIRLAAHAPHAEDEEPVYAGTCRDAVLAPGARASWRFRVRDGERVEFADGAQGAQCFEAGRDFGDFVVWRSDGVAGYQLAVVVDDFLMGVTEVVRGADLLVSAARQILLYRALGWAEPEWFHCPLLLDSEGRRLAKRHDALSVRALRERGLSAEQVRAMW